MLKLLTLAAMLAATAAPALAQTTAPSPSRMAGAAAPSSASSAAPAAGASSSTSTAPAGTAASAAVMAKMMQTCQADFAKQCPDKKAGTPEMTACVRDNFSSLSETCQGAIMEMMAARGG